MKIGILTFHDAINYGAVLQAQALCSTVGGFDNVECEIINYECKNIEEMYRTKSGNVLVQKIKSLYQKIKRNAFKKYLRNNSLLSMRVFRQTIKKFALKYDAVIVGSDQVWNRGITGGDPSFLLDFCDEKTIKASYAASFGNFEVTEKDVQNYQCLAKFNGLSVREPKGQKIIKNIIGREAEIHIDPTFLKDQTYWRQCAKAPKYTRKYIFIYAMGNTTRIQKAAKMLHEKTGYDIYYMGDFKLKEGKKLSYVTPAEWLGLFDRAEMILTNSFHGTAFSIIFRKNFFVDLGKIGNAIHNDRAANLLKLFGLENQVVENVGILYNRTPDWKCLEERITIQKEKALSYLHCILRNKEEKNASC